MIDRRATTSILLLALATATACGAREPRAIVEGHDSCEYCRMSISDARFGAQVITATGKIHTFDSVECVAGYVASLTADMKVTGVYVTDFENAGAFVPAEQAVYLMDGRIESPMGRRLVAFAPATDTAQLLRDYGGAALSWQQVQERLATLSHEHAAAGGQHAY